jgi:arginase
LRPLVLGGDHSISFPVVRAVSEKLGGPVDILHLDAHPDIYHCFEGNKYSHASSFARIMEGGYARRLLQVCFHLSIYFFCISYVFVVNLLYISAFKP